ncbi:glycosyl hydrolase [Sodiomyces alkalinus F11]|uniref:Glycosyl hydrolase n=1 Tax=Sodiomyces alkalinus (strain CBS 110278 / VKM F-3762 / F11) TaxID=1314773 RepID=A0A3N2PIZ6_SODAK|nr:glycosyl hydrolase [Sodiomyces alkalinus F11]ROT34508.1 glycosyl hydrolase [Sodiomyces alkalinus F11]
MTTNTKPLSVLIFSKTSWYRHDSIEPAVAALKALASHSGLFTVTHTEDPDACLTKATIPAFDVVLFLQCTGDFLAPHHVDALQDHILRRRGRFVAVHGAAAGMLNDETYASLVGALFDSHPPPERGRVVVEEAARGHFILGGGSGEGGVEGRDGWVDEWYNFATHPRENDRVRVLMRGDPTSFAGGKMGDDHPLVWCQEFDGEDGGRSFFTALGHFEEAYSDDWFMGVLLRAILWTGRAEGMWKRRG